MAFHIFKKKSKPARKTAAEENGSDADVLPSDGDTSLGQETIDDDRQDAQFLPPSETPPPPPQEEPPPSSSGSGFYHRLRNGLTKTRRLLTTDIDELFSAGKQLTEDDLDDLEERLITADIGVNTSMEIMERLSNAKVSDTNQLKDTLKDIFLSYLQSDDEQSIETIVPASGPLVILIVGVNGVGKTTTIGKLAARYIGDGKKVMMVAADTFRAAAIEQLEIWAQRTGADFIKHRENSDPAAVVFDGLEAARARDIDVVLIDTAGRLHTKVNLMEELKKIRRTIARKIPGAPHEVLLVLDATTGQNALSQADLFAQATGLTGIALTKLDGTAKGGIVVNLCHTFNVPLRYIGVGEQMNDLQPFDPEAFLEALF